MQAKKQKTLRACNDNHAVSRIHKNARVFFVLLLLPLFASLFAEQALASYSDGDFPSTIVMYNPTNSASCSADPSKQNNCNAIRAGGKEIVCPNMDFVNSGGDHVYTFGLVRRIIPCIRDTMTWTANQYLVPLVQFFSSVVQAASVLAIALLGILMVSGRTTAPWRDSMVLAMKLAGVTFAMSHLYYDPDHPGQFAILPRILDMMDNMVGIVLTPVLSGSFFAYLGDCKQWSDPADYNSGPTILFLWDLLDCSMEMLIGGILSAVEGQTIQYGILGFLLACIMSNGLGVTVGLIGFYLVIQFIWAILRAIYMYISAYVGVVVCMLVAPLFIPTILFRTSIVYFSRWVQTLGGFVMQPIIIFAYLGMLVSAFDVLVFVGPNSLSRALVGSSVDNSSFMSSGGIGGWMYTMPVYATKSLHQAAVVMNENDAIHNTNNANPQSAPNYGAPGLLATSGVINTVNTDFFGALGITGSDSNTPSFVGVDLPAQAVDWNYLRANAFNDAQGNHYQDSNYNPDTFGSDPDGGKERATMNYLIDVLKTAIMAFCVGYIFLKMLDMLPFLSAAIAMGGNDGDALHQKMLSAGRLGPPGAGGGKGGG